MGGETQGRGLVSPGGREEPHRPTSLPEALRKRPLTPDLFPEGPVSEARSPPVLIIGTLIWLSTATKETRESHVTPQGQRSHQRWMGCTTT